MSNFWRRSADDRIVLSVHAQPGASKTEIVGLHGYAIKIRVASPPVDGKANQTLRVFLAKVFAVRQADVELVSGQSSRAKQFLICNSSTDPDSLLQA